MKKYAALFFSLFLAVTLCGCSQAETPAQVAATTLPVYELTVRLCRDTPLSVIRLITEEVSCLHDYSLNVQQVKAAEAADIIVISGAGLEEFMEDLLADRQVIDASLGIPLLIPSEHSHDHHEEAHHEEEDHEGHHHKQDPHIWLSPIHAMAMAENICSGLSGQYPDYKNFFSANLTILLEELAAMQEYGKTALSSLSCRELITFHDGFAYLADAYDLTILDAIEEESGSEASAKELIHMIEEVEHHQLPAIFTEKSGSVSAAGIISRETGAKEFSLDMAMSGDSYFESMYHNIDTLKEALQ